MPAWWRRGPARQRDVEGFRLADLATSDTPALAPELTDALAAAPRRWRNCLDRDAGDVDDPDEMDLTLVELLGFVEVGAERGGWSFGVDDEVKSVVDTGLDEDVDPVLAVLRADPRVTEADHPDREWYAWRVSSPLTPAQAAALVLRALSAGHRHALSAAGLADPDGPV